MTFKKNQVHHLLLNTKIVLYSVFIFLLLHSCKQNKLSDLVVDNLNKNEDLVNICLSNFTWFDWDNFYVFPELYSSENISEELGIKYKKDVPLGKYRMIFTKQNRIVYEEDIYKSEKKNKSYIYIKNIRKISYINDCVKVDRYRENKSCPVCVKYILSN